MNSRTGKAQPRRPTVVTVAGSDSGGGAGIQADLQTFAALEVHGTTAITCITAQNTSGVSGISAVSATMVRQQLEAIYGEWKPTAAKTGMLYSREIIEETAAFFSAHRTPLVIDPVMVATSGARLLKPSAIKAMKERLLPLATLITPNLDEAEVLVGKKITTLEELREAARVLHKRFGTAVLVKGGHLPGREAVDFLNGPGIERAYRAPFIKGVSMHGSGCTYSAAIAAWLARGLGLQEAVAHGKKFITHKLRSV